jgi:PAS domain S-box-containing protein
MTVTLLDIPALYGFLSSLISGAILILVWRVEPEERAAAAWGFSHLLNTVRFILEVIFTAKGITAGYLIDGLVVVILIGLLVGCAHVLQRRVPVLAFILGGLAVWGLLAGLRFSGTSPETASLCRVFISGACLIAAGLAFQITWRRTGSGYYAALAVVMYVWACLVVASRLFSPSELAAIYLGLAGSTFRLASAVLFVLAVQRRVIDRLRGQVEVRRQAESAALANQRRFEDLTQLASDWIWESDSELRPTFISPRFSEILGLSAEKFIDLTPEQVRAEMGGAGDWSALLAALEEHKPFRNLRLRIVHPGTGRLVHFDISGKPIVDDAGHFVGFRGTGRDMTREVETRSTLDAIVGGVAHAVGRDYFEALVSHLATTLEMDGALVSVLHPSEPHGRTLAVWIAGTARPNYHFTRGASPCVDMRASGTCAVPAGAVRLYPNNPTLQRYPAEGYVLTLLRDRAGIPIGVIEVLKQSPIPNVDVAALVLEALAHRAAAELERQLGAEQLSESEQRFRAVLDNMPIGVLLFPDGKRLIANRTFAAWADASVEAIESMDREELDRRLGWSEELRHESLEAERVVRKTGQTVTIERDLPLADGGVHNIICATFPITAAGGAVAAVGIAMTDITELRAVESRLVKAQRMDALGRLAGGIAHDFNNIVGAIAGFAHFILEDEPATLSTHKHAQRILSASTRAKQIIQQILAFSRSSGIKLQTVPIGSALEETLNLLRATIPSSTRIEVEAVLPNAMVTADASQLVQILLNIGVNANDALGDRPGRIAFAVGEQPGAEVADELAQDATVAERLDGARVVAGKIDRALRYVSIRVRDSGCGMTRDVLERIFEPFFTTKPAGQGTGLGLSMVHGIVLNHGGAIAVTSRRWSGTTFQIWLPAAAEPAAAEGRSGRDRAPGGAGRILVVDDDQDFGDMVATSMERLGYEVAIVDDPTQALVAFDESPGLWDLLITDQTMPDIAGLDLIAHVKKKRPDLPCVLCTGYDHLVTELAALRVGVNAYLPKPVDPVVLGQTVARLLIAGAGASPTSAGQAETA